MIELIILKICFTSACFGWLYVEKFTANYGFLDWVPSYYPRKLERLLNCSFCVAGWVSIGATIINYKTFGIDTTFYVCRTFIHNDTGRNNQQINNNTI